MEVLVPDASHVGSQRFLGGFGLYFDAISSPHDELNGYRTHVLELSGAQYVRHVRDGLVQRNCQS